MPISYWTDCSTESKYTGDLLITGKNVEVKYVQKRSIVDFSMRNTMIPKCHGFEVRKIILKYVTSRGFFVFG